jgi:CDP-diacylglycerol--glycerol-3-phosphate 3-phosphatidyltransferase
MSSDYLVQEVPLLSLRRRWGMMALLFVASLGLGHQLLHAEWQPAFAWRWTTVAAGVLVYELGFLWRGLRDNRRPAESLLLPTFGAGNLLTLLRGLVLGLLAGFLFSPWPWGWLGWLPAVLYTLASLADYLDGYLARITRHATLLGAQLDIEFDAMGMLVATTLAVHYNQLPWWYLILGLSRYLFLFGIWWRQRLGKPVYDLTPSVHRRIVAGFQMSFMSVMLWPLVHPPATTLVGIVFALPFTASFGRDWLVVSGRIDPTSHAYLEVRRKLAILMTHWLPVMLRIGMVTIAVGLVLPALQSAANRVALFGWPGVPFVKVTATVISLIALAAIVMLILGAAGRLAALGLLSAAMANIHTRGLGLANGFLLAASIALMLLGSGPFSYWRPEDAILSRRAGGERGGADQ